MKESETFAVLRLDARGGQYVNTWPDEATAFREALRQSNAAQALGLGWQYLVLCRRSGEVLYRVGTIEPEDDSFQGD